MLSGLDYTIREMSEIIKDENVDAAAVNMQAHKHTLEMMDLTFGVDNAINSLNRYREDTLGLGKVSTSPCVACFLTYRYIHSLVLE